MTMKKLLFLALSMLIALPTMADDEVKNWNFENNEEGRCVVELNIPTEKDAKTVLQTIQRNLSKSFVSNNSGSTVTVTGSYSSASFKELIEEKVDVNRLADPTVLSKMITCAEFDFIIKAQNYLIDKANSPSESHAVPTLDGDGNPIVTSTNTINARIKANNDIEYRNRLIIKMDGIQFRECHGSMCEGYFSAVDNVIISNTEESWNYLDPANDYTREKMHGTQWDIFTVGSKKALSVVMFGDKYKVENKLIQLDGSRNKITNTRSEIYRTGGARMKIYLMPVVCTISAENISSGATIETFNTGDVIDCVSYRKISVSD